MSWNDSSMGICDKCGGVNCEYWSMGGKWSDNNHGYECLDCGSSSITKLVDYNLSLKEVNENREMYDLNPLKKLKNILLKEVK